MAKTMKAAVVRSFKQKLSIEEVPIPVPGPGEVLVKVVAFGVCHTDLHAAAGEAVAAVHSGARGGGVRGGGWPGRHQA